MMPLIFTVPPQSHRPPVVDPTDLNGEDVSLRGGDLTVTAHGDWAVLTGAEAARQSVEREAVASPGDMPRRPQWGVGLRDSLLRPSSRELRDRQASSVRRRLLANPRIDTVDTVDVSQHGDLAPGAVTVTIAAKVRGQSAASVMKIQPTRRGT